MQDPRGAPPPLRKAPPPAQETANVRPAGDRFPIGRGRIEGPQRIVIYGPGGIGKSSLCALAPNPVFLDIEGGTRELDVQRVSGIDTWADLRACLRSDVLDRFGTVVVDTMTKAQELAIAWMLLNVKNEKGGKADNIEAYGFGKGYQHLFDVELNLLGDFDAHIRAGRNVIAVCHDVISNVPNPAGEDYIRWELDLIHPKSGKASYRNRLAQWADHVVRVAYDVAEKDGKAKGSGTRTIYTCELPHHVAKSRSLRLAIPFQSAQDDSLWRAMFPEGRAA